MQRGLLLITFLTFGARPFCSGILFTILLIGSSFSRSPRSTLPNREKVKPPGPGQKSKSMAISSPKPGTRVQNQVSKAWGEDIHFLSKTRGVI
uniref:Uncharacterized protein n=1 Tax=Picea glauca TaxID=3330 RepID=A0A101LVP0_PICGL|nr:hypothetical protein ABT39_MTgene2018 [Picea glauca]QHR86169.1 hypothetical protein Q903MT_gene168 [Picea sitchensis]